jgi:hypothetical protein
MRDDYDEYNSQLPLIPGNDGWGDAAGDSGERLIKGQLIKFADWRWTIGKEREEVASGRRFEALATAACWQHWKDGKPDKTIMREPGRRLPERDELGDLDETEWEFFGADPQDPWRNTRLVYLIDPRTTKDFTFSTSSYGGRAAVSDLGEQITRMRLIHADAVPIVELGAIEMPTKYGPKSKPVFKVVGWKTRDTEHVIEREINPRQAKKLVDESNDPDDSIPF